MLPRKTLIATLLMALGLVTLLLATAACGGGEDVDADSGDDSAATTAAAEGPGTITLSSSAITGQSGKILLVFADSSAQQRFARACVQITTDDFTLSGVAMTDMPAGENPCGDDTPETTFDEGTYTLLAGIYVAGKQTPETETSLTVDVAGDTVAEIDGAALSN